MEKKGYEKFFFNYNDLPIHQLSHTFGQISAWIKDKNYKSAVATFDLYIREMPKNRNFLIFSGLEELLAHIPNLRFSVEHINHLKRMGLVYKDVENYLKYFKFTGNINKQSDYKVKYSVELLKIFNKVKKERLMKI